MADTAPKIAEAEIAESDDVIEAQATKLAELIRDSKHFIAFTGAGVSTSAGIADFRGPQGVWTLRAQGRDDEIESKDTLQAIPTPTHMALVELQDRGVLKYLVSQNCDGLHRRSGILPDRISELHGNSNKEWCRDGCGQEYIRDFYAAAPDENHVHDHRTGRKCAKCKKPLHDTIINFGEYLPKEPLRLARQHARKADLCLALGSSLTVPPACNIPETVGLKKATRGKPGGTLAICNLQSTPLDDIAEWRLRAKTDDLMIRVMDKLGYPIPQFVLRRRLTVQIKTDAKDAKRHTLLVAGQDVDGTPATFLKSIKLASARREIKQEPFAIQVRGELEGLLPLKVELAFMGHYGEPNLEIDVEGTSEDDDGVDFVLWLEYDPYTGTWTTGRV